MSAPIEVLEIRRVDAGNVTAFCKVRISAVVIHGCKVVQRPGQRAWIALPQTQSKYGKWFPVIEVTSLDRKRRIADVVLKALPAVDPFPLELLAGAVRPWIEIAAERRQAPLDYNAVAVMVALGSALGRQITIRPKRYDDWTLVPNLRGAVIGRPGVLKTPVLEEALWHLRAMTHVHDRLHCMPKLALQSPTKRGGKMRTRSMRRRRSAERGGAETHTPRTLKLGR